MEFTFIMKSVLKEYPKDAILKPDDTGSVLYPSDQKVVFLKDFKSSPTK